MIYNSKMRMNRINPIDAKRMLDNNYGAIFLDVRDDSEYMINHIPGAMNLPYSNIKQKIENLIPNKNKTIVVYCQSGGRATVAEQSLYELGYTNIYNLGGIIDWPYRTEKSV